MEAHELLGFEFLTRLQTGHPFETAPGPFDRIFFLIEEMPELKESFDFRASIDAVILRRLCGREHGKLSLPVPQHIGFDA
jgi:hypothetical protein